MHRLQVGAGGSASRYLAFLAAALRLGRRAADLYIGHDMHGFLPAWLLSRWYRRPLVYHCHELVDGSSALSPGGRAVLAFQRRFARTADLVIAPDEERAAIMKSDLELPSLPFVAVNSPVRWPKSAGHRLQNALAARGHRFRQVVLRQGSIGPSHAIETTIQSIPDWADERWGFVALGRGSAQYLGHLHNLAERYGVAERFVTLPPVSYDEVTQFTGGADLGHALYCPIDSNTRFSTTASNKLLEYMAAGLPVLVSDRPGLRAFVEKHQCGLAVDESSPESIAMAVNTVLGDPNLAQRFGAAGAMAFEAELNYERQFAPVLAAFQSMCRASGEC
jgi:glycosyltransferase involved in cell wall biosynthesis